MSKEWQKEWAELCKINFDGLDGKSRGIGETELKVRTLGLGFIQNLLDKRTKEIVDSVKCIPLYPDDYKNVLKWEESIKKKYE